MPSWCSTGSLELSIHLSQSLQCWNYVCVQAVHFTDLLLENNMCGAGEKAQWSKAWTALAEDQSLAPRAHIRQLTLSCNSSPRRSWPSSGPLPYSYHMALPAVMSSLSWCVFPGAVSQISPPCLRFLRVRCLVTVTRKQHRACTDSPLFWLGFPTIPCYLRYSFSLNISPSDPWFSFINL